jgi:branched-chain amino acid aminotransferase
LTELIKKLVMVDKDWIPKEKGYSLYIRESPVRAKPYSDLVGPTLIGTQAQLGVGPNSDALLFVICSPVSYSYLYERPS